MQMLAFLALSLSTMTFVVETKDAVIENIWLLSTKREASVHSTGANDQITTLSARHCAVFCGATSSCDEFCFNSSSGRCFMGSNVRPTNDPVVEPPGCYRRCPLSSGYSLHHNRCVKMHVTPPTSDTMAIANCSADHAHLFNILTLEDLQAVSSLIAGRGALPNYVLLGAKKSGGVFTWTENSTLSQGSYLWGDGEPNNKQGVEDCVGMKVLTLKLSDIGCHDARSFLCQIDVD
ncbi:hypothetical protein V1264_000631 [Littorina saxatilis]